MRAHQPIHLGSPRFRTIDTGTFRVTEAWFPPGAVLEPHTHDRSILAVMLDGSFETHIARRRIDCAPATTWTEPCAETHANHCGSVGAHVIVTQPDPAKTDLLQPFTALLTEVSDRRDPMLALDARRAAAELDQRDSLTPLALDGLVMLLMTRATRGSEPRRVRARGVPAWLARARDLVHDRFRDGITLREIADAADVTPWHLARSFRRRFGTSIGEYARALRVTWALDRLARSDAPISEIAASAGFADQSHLTRACRALTGMPPAAFRRHSRA